LIDIHWPVRVNAASYDVQFATNFDAVFTTFQNVPNWGFRSVSASEAMGVEQFRNKTRFLFAPSDYPPMVDNAPIWIRFRQIDVDGTVNPFEAIHLVLPYDSGPRPPVILNGNAPAAATIAGSLELQLPHHVNSIFLTNNDPANSLFVSFNSYAPEIEVTPLVANFVPLSSDLPMFNQLFVRGAGGIVNFTASVALVNSGIR
jgi:hypothetical protein